MNQASKVVTCHAGARDAYQLSIAFEEAKLLKCLITDIYFPEIIGRRYKKRFSEELPNSKVVSLYGNVIRQKLLKHSFSDTDRRLSLRAYKSIQGNDASLILCSYTAYDAFKLVKSNGLKNLCLLFQLHPHPLSIRKLLLDELLMVPCAKDSILLEPEMDVDLRLIERLDSESRLADHCLVASSYTRTTLMENGINSGKITVIPYGVDPTNFPRKSEYSAERGRLRVVFVGQIIQRKGLYYLLEAIKRLRTKNVELILIGRGVIDQNLLNEYAGKINLTVRANLAHRDLISELHQADLLLFPSLIEGFGHVILEAMSAGLPVLCTNNTAGPDLFLNGNEGIIVPIRNVEAISEKIDYFIDNPAEVESMGRAAATTARVFTWEKFRTEVVQFYCKFR